MICKLGMETVFQYIFFYMGLAYTTGVKSAIINGSQTFIAILMACLIFRYEKLTMQKFMGCLIGFAGVIVINFDPSGMTGGFTLRGEGAILVAAIAYALSSTLVKRYSQKESPVVLSGYQFVFGDPNYALDTLTEKGWQEAMCLAERIAPMDIKAYYVSPMGRAQDTASVTLQKAGRRAETCTWLREFDVRIKNLATGKPCMVWELPPEVWTVVPEFYDKDKWCQVPVMVESGAKES